VRSSWQAPQRQDEDPALTPAASLAVGGSHWRMWIEGQGERGAVIRHFWRK
jgi:hypothetical protein